MPQAAVRRAPTRRTAAEFFNREMVTGSVFRTNLRAGRERSVSLLGIVGTDDDRNRLRRIGTGRHDGVHCVEVLVELRIRAGVFVPSPVDQWSVRDPDAKDEPVVPVPSMIDNMARLKYIVKTTLMHQKETSCVRADAPSREMEVNTNK